MTKTNNNQKNLSRPFENYDQKSNSKKSISLMSIDEEEPIDHNGLSAMISNQANIANIVHDECTSDNYFGENIISVLETTEFANKPTICSKIFDNDPARKLQCHLKLQPQALPYNIPKHLKQNFKVDSYTPKKLLDIISQVHQNDQKKPKHSYIHQLSTIFSNVHENQFMKIADLVISLICLVLTRKLC